MTPRTAFAENIRRTAHTSLGVSEFGYHRLRTAPGRYREAAAGVAHLPRAVLELADRGIDVASVVEPYWPRTIRQTAACRLEGARQRRNDFTERGEAIARDWRARRRRAA